MINEPLILANASSAATLFKAGVLCGGIAVVLIAVAICGAAD